MCYNIMDMDHYTSFTMAYLFMCFCVVPACVITDKILPHSQYMDEAYTCLA